MKRKKLSLILSASSSILLTPFISASCKDEVQKTAMNLTADKVFLDVEDKENMFAKNVTTEEIICKNLPDDCGINIEKIQCAEATVCVTYTIYKKDGSGEKSVLFSKIITGFKLEEKVIAPLPTLTTSELDELAANITLDDIYAVDHRKYSSDVYDVKKIMLSPTSKLVQVDPELELIVEKVSADGKEGTLDIKASLKQKYGATSTKSSALTIKGFYVPLDKDEIESKLNKAVETITQDELLIPYKEFYSIDAYPTENITLKNDAKAYTIEPNAEFHIVKKEATATTKGEGQLKVKLTLYGKYSSKEHVVELNGFEKQKTDEEIKEELQNKLNSLTKDDLIVPGKKYLDAEKYVEINQGKDASLTKDALEKIGPGIDFKIEAVKGDNTTQAVDFKITLTKWTISLDKPIITVDGFKKGLDKQVLLDKVNELNKKITADDIQALWKELFIASGYDVKNITLKEKFIEENFKEIFPELIIEKVDHNDKKQTLTIKTQLKLNNEIISDWSDYIVIEGFKNPDANKATVDELKTLVANLTEDDLVVPNKEWYMASEYDANRIYLNPNSKIFELKPSQIIINKIEAKDDNRTMRVSVEVRLLNKHKKVINEEILITNFKEKESKDEIITKLNEAVNTITADDLVVPYKEFYVATKYPETYISLKSDSKVYDLVPTPEIIISVTNRNDSLQELDVVVKISQFGGKYTSDSKTITFKGFCAPFAKEKEAIEKQLNEEITKLTVSDLEAPDKENWLAGKYETSKIKLVDSSPLLNQVPPIGLNVQYVSHNDDERWLEIKAQLIGKHGITSNWSDVIRIVGFAVPISEDEIINKLNEYVRKITLKDLDAPDRNKYVADQYDAKNKVNIHEDSFLADIDPKVELVFYDITPNKTERTLSLKVGLKQFSVQHEKYIESTEKSKECKWLDFALPVDEAELIKKLNSFVEGLKLEDFIIQNKDKYIASEYSVKDTNNVKLRDDHEIYQLTPVPMIFIERKSFDIEERTVEFKVRIEQWGYPSDVDKSFKIEGLKDAHIYKTDELDNFVNGLTAEEIAINLHGSLQKDVFAKDVKEEDIILDLVNGTLVKDGHAENLSIIEAKIIDADNLEGKLKIQVKLQENEDKLVVGVKPYKSTVNSQVIEITGFRKLHVVSEDELNELITKLEEKEYGLDKSKNATDIRLSDIEEAINKFIKDQNYEGRVKAEVSKIETDDNTRTLKFECQLIEYNPQLPVGEAPYKSRMSTPLIEEFNDPHVISQIDLDKLLQDLINNNFNVIAASKVASDIKQDEVVNNAKTFVENEGFEGKVDVIITSFNPNDIEKKITFKCKLVEHNPGATVTLRETEDTTVAITGFDDLHVIADEIDLDILLTAEDFEADTNKNAGEIQNTEIKFSQKGLDKLAAKDLKDKVILYIFDDSIKPNDEIGELKFRYKLIEKLPAGVSITPYESDIKECTLKGFRPKHVVELMKLNLNAQDLNVADFSIKNNVGDKKFASLVKKEDVACDAGILKLNLVNKAKLVVVSIENPDDEAQTVVIKYKLVEINEPLVQYGDPNDKPYETDVYEITYDKLDDPHVIAQADLEGITKSLGVNNHQNDFLFNGKQHLEVKAKNFAMNEITLDINGSKSWFAKNAQYKDKVELTNTEILELDSAEGSLTLKFTLKEIFLIAGLNAKEREFTHSIKIQGFIRDISAEGIYNQLRFIAPDKENIYPSNATKNDIKPENNIDDDYNYEVQNIRKTAWDEVTFDVKVWNKADSTDSYLAKGIKINDFKIAAKDVADILKYHIDNEENLFARDITGSEIELDNGVIIPANFVLQIQEVELTEDETINIQVLVIDINDFDNKEIYEQEFTKLKKAKKAAEVINELKFHIPNASDKLIKDVQESDVQLVDGVTIDPKFKWKIIEFKKGTDDITVLIKVTETLWPNNSAEKTCTFNGFKKQSGTINPDVYNKLNKNAKKVYNFLQNGGVLFEEDKIDKALLRANFEAHLGSNEKELVAINAKASNKGEIWTKNKGKVIEGIIFNKEMWNILLTNGTDESIYHPDLKTLGATAGNQKGFVLKRGSQPGIFILEFYLCSKSYTIVEEAFYQFELDLR